MKIIKLDTNVEMVSFEEMKEYKVYSCKNSFYTRTDGTLLEWDSDKKLPGSVFLASTAAKKEKRFSEIKQDVRFECEVQYYA